MFLGSLKVHMWHKLLAAFPLMDQDGLKKEFGTCFPFAPPPTQRGLVSLRILPAAQVPGDGGQALFQTSPTSMLQLLTLKLV